MAEWKDGANDRLMSAITSEIDQPAIVTSFVLIADITLDTGERLVITNGAPDQRAQDSLGLLRLAQVRDEEEVRREWFRDDD